jgi:hypothetical protein
MLAAYADESVDTSPGHNGSMSVSAFGGFVASVDEWTRFSAQWQRILNNFDAEFFHFSQWAIASAVARKVRRPFSDFSKNPYCGWKLKKLNSFLLELGEVAAARMEGTFGAFISAEKFKERKAAGVILLGQDHRDWCLRRCFESFVDVLNARWAHFRGEISFVWDATRDLTWKQSITAAYEPFKNNNPRFRAIAFADDKFCLPLQAADLLAYRMRQKTDKGFKGERSIMSDLDKALFGDGKRGRLFLFNSI